MFRLSSLSTSTILPTPLPRRKLALEEVPLRNSPFHNSASNLEDFPRLMDIGHQISESK